MGRNGKVQYLCWRGGKTQQWEAHLLMAGAPSGLEYPEVCCIHRTPYTHLQCFCEGIINNRVKWGSIWGTAGSTQSLCKSSSNVQGWPDLSARGLFTSVKRLCHKSMLSFALVTFHLLFACLRLNMASDFTWSKVEKRGPLDFFKATHLCCASHCF